MAYIPKSNNVGRIVALTRDIETDHGTFTAGHIMTIIDFTPRGYDLRDADGNLLLETGLLDTFFEFVTDNKIEPQATEQLKPVQPVEKLMGVRVDWTESERGWGQKPDGTTLYLNMDDAHAHIKAHWDREAELNKSNGVPDYYIRPDKPEVCDISKYVDAIKKAKEEDLPFWVVNSGMWNGK